MTGMETDLKLIGQVGRAAISIALAGVALPFIAGVAFGQFLPDTLGSSLSILLPATGTLASRRAAEIAVTLTRSRRIPITALYVASTQPGPTGAESGRLRHVTPMAPREEAILKDVVDLADRYGVSVRTAIRIQTPPDQAILDQVKRGRHNLIVMGVNRRPGDRLFFGNVAATVLRKSKVSISFVSS
jgi:nucleotide-binding universal stress UspA family protein